MHSKLGKVQDWPLLAKNCGYRISQMAHQTGVSREWLEIWVKKRFGLPAHQLLAAWRSQEILRLAREGVRGDKLAKAVGFANRSNLWHSVQSSSGPGLREFRDFRS